jgi:hypothetical protein
MIPQLIADAGRVWKGLDCEARLRTRDMANRASHPTSSQVNVPVLMTASKPRRMKTLMTAMAIASLLTASAVAKTLHRAHVDRSNMYHSYSQGSQSYENPDRTFGSGNEPPAQ